MVKEGVLCRVFIGRGNYESYLQLIVPQILGETVLAELNEGSTEGHLGPEKTLDKLKEYFYWPRFWTFAGSTCSSVCPKYFTCFCMKTHISARSFKAN